MRGLRGRASRPSAGLRLVDVRFLVSLSDAMSTYLAKPGELQAQWYVVDATDQVLGRLAAKIARVLQGKNKPTFTPHVDTGDFVIVLNAEKIRVTGAKAQDREYQTY